MSEFIAKIDDYIEQGVTDGLPVIPPSVERVEAMVAASGRGADEVVGLLPPTYGEANVRDVAINATMAGCLPEYMPVILAAVEVMLEPSFHLDHLATSTKGNAPLVIVNGPIRKEIGLNCTKNVLGPGARANATIGRAIRLLLINVGGSVPGVTDHSCFGHGGKYTYTIGEDEESSPWEPLHVESGFAAEDSTVTVMGSEAPRYVSSVASPKCPEVTLLRIADTMSTLASFGMTGRSEAFVLLGPDHRNAVAEAGWSKADVRNFLHERSGRPAADLDAGQPPDRPGSLPHLREREGYRPDDWIPVFGSADDIHIVAAGGAGIVSLVCYGSPSLDYGRHGQRRIDRPNGVPR
ncbi:MAG: hypothetical protein GEV03_04085 [Streptosporangiales bacterium]|nr:hypothetical protein [Streptosporangiales bacterium]